MPKADTHLSLKDRPHDERPREKLESLGASALTDAELLGILLRVGGAGESAVDVGARLLNDYEGLPGLARTPFDTLKNTRNVRLAKAAQIAAALELGRRAYHRDAGQEPTVRSPQEVANFIRARTGYRHDQEQLWAVAVDSRNRILKAKCVVEGSVNSVQIRPAEVFRDAVALNAVAVIVAHTHPSGDPAPSSEDVTVTRQIVQAGRALDIQVLDHLILGRQNLMVSLKERGLGFE